MYNKETRASRSVADVILKAKSSQAPSGKKNIVIKNTKLKTSSQDWLRRHMGDKFVIQAQKDGYISRAAYKLLDIDKKFHVIAKSKYKILDLGCAPGSWMQVLDQQNKECIGVDLLPLQIKTHNIFIQGDFTDIEIQKQIMQSTNSKIDLILSDIAPNMSGLRDHDVMAMEGMIDVILDFASQYLCLGGNLVFKAFHGSLDSKKIQEIRKFFSVVKLFKPSASRQDSSEIYCICMRKLDNSVHSYNTA